MSEIVDCEGNTIHVGDEVTIMPAASRFLNGARVYIGQTYKVVAVLSSVESAIDYGDRNPKILLSVPGIYQDQTVRGITYYDVQNVHPLGVVKVNVIKKGQIISFLEERAIIEDITSNKDETYKYKLRFENGESLWVTEDFKPFPFCKKGLNYEIL